MNLVINGVCYTQQAQLEAAIKDGQVKLTPEMKENVLTVFPDIKLGTDQPAPGLTVEKNQENNPVDAEAAQRQQSNAKAEAPAAEVSAVADAAKNPPTAEQKSAIQEQALGIYEKLQESVLDEEASQELRKQYNQLKTDNPSVDLSPATLRSLKAQKSANETQATRLEAAKLAEHSKVDSEGLTVTNYANEEGRVAGSPQESHFQLKARTQRVEVDEQNIAEAKIRGRAQYTDKNGVVHRGVVDLEKIKNDLKAEQKAQQKELKDLQKELKNTPHPISKEFKSASPERQAEIRAKREQLAKQIWTTTESLSSLGNEVTEAEQAYKTAAGKGVSKQAKETRKLQQKYNDQVDRTMTFATKEQMEAAVKQDPSLKGHVGYLNEKQLYVLEGLKFAAEQNYNPNGHFTSNDEIQRNKMWGALRQIEIPTENDTPEEVARKTRINQTALITVSGGDNTIEETEKKIMLEADGLKAMGLGLGRTDINKLYQSYGLHNENRLKGRFRDAGESMLKALPGAAAGFLVGQLSSHLVTAIAEAEQHSVATAGYDYCVKAIATAIAHAEASVPGFTFQEYDPETQRYIMHEIAGQFNEQTQTVVNEAIEQGHISVTAVADAKAKAVAEAKSGPSIGSGLLTAAINVGVAGIMGFLTSKGEERGVNNGDAKAYKNAQFIQMHKGDAAKGIAQELLELRDQLATKMGGNIEQANDQLAEAYGAYEGVQNSVMTIQELAAMRDGFRDYVNKYQKPEAPEPTPTTDPKPTTDPTPNTNSDPVVEDKYYATRTEELDKRIPWNRLNQSPHYVATMYKFIGPDGQEYNMLSGSELNRKNHALYQDFANHVYGRAEDDNVNKDIENKNTYLYPKVMNLGNGWKAVLVTDNMKLDSGVNKPRRKGKGKGKAPQATKSKMRTDTVGSGSTQDGVDNTEGQNYRSRNASDVDNHFQDQGRKKSSKTLSGDK